MAWLRMVFRLHQTSLSPFTSHLFRTNQSTMPTLRWVKRDLHAGAGGASAGDKRTREEENAAAVAVTSGAEVNAASTSTERIRVIDIVLPLVKSGNPDWSLLTVLGSFLLPNLVQYDQATGHLTVVEGKLEEFLPAMKAKLLKILPPHKAGAFKARTTAPGQYNRQMKEMGWVVSKSSDGSLVYRHQHGFGVGKDAATHWRRPKEQRSRLKEASLAKQVGVAEQPRIAASPPLTSKRPHANNATGPAAASGGSTATAVQGCAETLWSQQLHEKGGEEMRAAMKRRQEEMRAAMKRRQQREKEEMKQRHRKEQEELDRLVLEIRATSSKAGSGDSSFFEEDADAMELH